VGNKVTAFPAHNIQFLLGKKCLKFIPLFNAGNCLDLTYAQIPN